MFLNIENLTLDKLDCFPSYFSLHYFFQRCQHIRMGVDWRINLWASFLGLKDHHLTTRFLRGVHSLFMPKKISTITPNALGKESRYKGMIKGILLWLRDIVKIIGSNEVKYTSGYEFTLYRGAIFWKSFKQTFIACAVIEPKFIVLDKSNEETEWLQLFLEDIPF